MPTNNEAIQSYLYKHAKAAISKFAKKAKTDVYAISFLLDTDLSPRQPKATIGYNTLARFEQSKHNYVDEGEAKWQLISWQHDQETLLCENDSKVEDWRAELEAEISDTIPKNDMNKGTKLCEKLFDAFVKMIISIARKLHEDGILEKKFGRDIPIIVCNSYFSSEPVEWTLQGNPDGQAAEFEAWKKSPSPRVSHERHEKLEQLLSDDWKDTYKDDMTPLEAYENLIDLLAFGYLSKSMSAKRLIERDDFNTDNPDNREQGFFLTGLTKKQREMIALMLLEERESVIHDILAMLTWRIDCSGLQFTWNGEPMPVDISGMGLHGDYVGRRDGWAWPVDEHGHAVSKERPQEEIDLNEQYCSHGVSNLMQCLIRRFSSFKPKHWKLVESMVDNDIRRCFDMFLLASDSDINTMDEYLEQAKKRIS